MKKFKLQLLSHKIVIAIVGVLLVGGVALAYQGSAPNIVVEGDFTGNFVEATQPVQPIDDELGAIPGSSVNTPDFSVNGLTKYSYSTGFNTATSTIICAIKSPQATSTLSFASASFSTSSTTASTITLAKATTAYATTTAIAYTTAFGANAKGTILASSTPTATGVGYDQAKVFAPNNWFTVGMQGGTGTFSPVGKCQAEFTAVE